MTNSDRTLSQSPEEQIVCQLLILRRHDTEYLVLSNGNLPTISVPRKQRVPPHITSGIKLFGIDAICRLITRRNENHIVVLDLLGSNHETAAYEWRSTSSIASHNLDLSATWRECNLYKTGSQACVFCQPDWFETVSRWVQHETGLGTEAVPPQWQQYNSGPYFALIRFESDRGAVWFKAVGAPNLREFSITRCLSQLDLPFIPKLLAFEDEWKAWAMEEIVGESLGASAPLERWKVVGTCLAQLQARSQSSVASLLSSGCVDVRVSSLRLKLKSFIKALQVLMRTQEAISVPPLDDNAIALIEQSLDRAFTNIGRAEIPITIGHSDLNSGNVLVQGNAAYFIDWMNGHIGPCLFSLEYLLCLLERLHPDRPLWLECFCDSYLAGWNDEALASRLRLALPAVRSAAALAFVVDWLDLYPEPTEIPLPLAKLLRSIGRRLYREACRSAR